MIKLTKLLTAVAIAVALPTTTHAVVGKTYLTAYDRAKGSQASVGRFGRQIQIRTQKPVSGKSHKKKAPSGATSPDRSVTLCGKTYFTTKRGVAWVAAHRKAGNELVVRKHTGKRKYAVLCGKIPKRRKTTRAKSK